MIEAGKIYYGPTDIRVFVIAIEADRVHVMRPSSCAQEWWSLADMESWASQSALRIYYPSDYSQNRIKVVTGTSKETNRMMSVGDDPNAIWVCYRLALGAGTLIWTPMAEWQAWRDALPPWTAAA